MPNDSPVDGRCNAHVGDGYCANSQMTNGRCRMHGGQSLPPGPAHPTYRHGRYSRLQIPPRLAERIAEAEADQELLSLRSDVAVIEARIKELLETVDTAATAESWEHLQSLVRTLELSVRAGDDEKVAEALEQLKQTTLAGAEVSRCWREIDRLMDRKRKLAESERKAQVESGQLILSAQAALMLDRLVGAVIQHVQDESALRAIQREYVRLVGAASDQPAG